MKNAAVDKYTHCPLISKCASRDLHNKIDAPKGFIFIETIKCYQAELLLFTFSVFRHSCPGVIYNEYSSIISFDSPVSIITGEQ